MRLYAQILVVFFCLANCVKSQEIDNFAATFSRLQATLALAKSESTLAKSDLEFVEGQRERVKELRQRHNDIVLEFRKLTTEEKHSPEGKAAILKKFANLEDELTTDILLPHQTELLRSKVFFHHVKSTGGNVVHAIMTYYPDQFKLSAEQKQKLTALQESTTKRIEEAKARFKKEIEEISKSTKNSLEKTLTAEQMDVIRKLQGKGGK